VTLSAPVLSIVEAKHAPIKADLVQCLTARVVVRLFHDWQDSGLETVYAWSPPAEEDILTLEFLNASIDHTEAAGPLIPPWTAEAGLWG
jgi:hypothetical protein